MWYIYILQCSDGSLYTGITTDVSRRLVVHNNGKGAKAIRGKLPVALVYQEEWENKILAAKREREIKGWKRAEKLALISRYPGHLPQKSL